MENGSTRECIYDGESCRVWPGHWTQSLVPGLVSQSPDVLNSDNNKYSTP
jgi:hypothetical protein